MALNLHTAVILGFLLFGIGANAQTCSQCVDIVALVDASADISANRFDAIKEKLKEITDSYAIGNGADEAQLAVVTFAKFMGFHWTFGSTETSSAADLMNAIDGLMPRNNGGSLRVRLAIDKTPERILNVDNRAGCEDICVIFIAERIRRFPKGFKQEISALQGRCTVYAIDADDAPVQTLQMLASDDNLVYNDFNNFEWLDLCPPTPECPGCADIVVLADSTMGVSPAVFDDLKSFLSNFESTSEFQISPTDYRISVVEYGTSVDITWTFTDSRATNAADFTNGVNALMLDAENESSKVRLAMEKTIAEILTGARNECEKVCIVTIGDTPFFVNMGMKAQIRELIDACDTTIAIGLTASSNEEFLSYFEDEGAQVILTDVGESASSKYPMVEDQICDELGGIEG